MVWRIGAITSGSRRSWSVGSGVATLGLLELSAPGSTSPGFARAKAVARNASRPLPTRSASSRVDMDEGAVRGITAIDREPSGCQAQPVVFH
jgi:hypothetical protein